MAVGSNDTVIHNVTSNKIKIKMFISLLCVNLVLRTHTPGHMSNGRVQPKV